MLYHSAFLFLLLFYFSKEEIKIFDINLQDKLHIKNISFDDTLNFKVKTKYLKPFTSYSLQIHRIGSEGISLDIKFICNDIINFKENKNNIRLNDVTRRTFKTNKYKFPNICNNKYDEDYFFFFFKPKTRVYQFINENDIKFNVMVNIVENIGGYTLRSFFSTGLYKGLIINLIIIPLLIYIFKNKIKLGLIRALDIDLKIN